MLLRHFDDAEAECARILAQPDDRPEDRPPHRHGAARLRPVHQGVSHLFNLLDARGVISVTERQAYIGRVRALAKACADAYVAAGQRMNGRRLMIAFLAFLAALRRGARLVPGLRLLPARAPASACHRRRAVPVAGYDGIDAASSPLKLRGCFRLDPAAAAALAPAPDATPLNAPFWFRCFDAGRLTADLAAGAARPTHSPTTRPRASTLMLAVYPDGRGYLWRQLNAPATPLMPDLLLELLSEEIPARMQPKAADDLRRLVTDGLVERGLTYAHAAAFATPAPPGARRRGPRRALPRPCARSARAPAPTPPTPAVEGFLRATGLTRDQLETRADKKGDVLVRRPRHAPAAPPPRSSPRPSRPRSAPSPGRSRCAGATAPCAGSARCTRSSAS